MTRSVFRGLLLGCFAMLAAAFTVLMPATASAEPFAQSYELRAHDAGDFLIVQPAAMVREDQADAIALGARSTVGTGPFHPVYELSIRTDAHSLDAAYHLGC